jgi:nucleoside-triphosphatase THEP1
MIFILTGPVHSGKTTLLNKVVRELKRQKYTVGGFLSEPILKNEENVGYDLFDLREERSFPLIRRTGEKKWQKIGSYFFIPQGLAKAEKIILGEKDVDILVVDEVGPLELSGKGFWPALKQVIFDPLSIYLLVIRINILEDFLKTLGECEVKIFDIKSTDIFFRVVEDIKIEKKGKRI